MKESQVVCAIRKAIGHQSISSWSREKKINRSVLADVLRGHIPPTQQLCAIIGVEKKTVNTYERIK